MRCGLTLAVGLLLVGVGRADDYPKTVLKNDRLKLTVFLPDATKGFYRGTRFDWAGVIGYVEVGGHKTFGPWKDTQDPTNNDDIVGPVEEFGMAAPLGYAEAREGETFLKIGVGELVKPREDAYRFYHNYTIQRPGTWQTTIGADRVEFKQAVDTKSGYGYRYTKQVVLDPTEAGFSIRHELTNTGTRPIDTDQYNHNFYNVDGDLIGPNYQVRFPAPVRVADPKERFAELVSVRKDSFVFTGKLDKGSVFTPVEGLAGVRGRFQISHAGSRLVLSFHEDKPLEKVNFWATVRTLCPEPFLRIRLQPGETQRWAAQYRFTVLKS
jgi:hypothetical protein